ncbi:MAG: PadR family transcriptional regulator [Lachnospiraceae bacterium]|nr:PadR family transcriptional regulator [Candidatus Equihabitans merdae]
MGREDPEATLSMEMRRGTIVLCVLSLLDKPSYGYNLVNELGEQGLAVEANTLYPLLRRLSSRGLLEDSWDTSGAKPRKYYKITDKGRALRKKMQQEWLLLSDAVSRIVSVDNP